tara:strand:+ start:2973 stop:3329 length:357 start_codon:yes stop_codon:yes gene_type:complete
MKLKYQNVNCKIDLKKYASGNTAIVLIEDIPCGQVIAKATVNLHEHPRRTQSWADIEGLEDERGELVWIKGWSEGEGMLEVLAEAGVVEDLNTSMDVNDFGSKAHLARLTMQEACCQG